jgi:hypothetical protein
MLFSWTGQNELPDPDFIYMKPETAEMKGRFRVSYVSLR